ncbi:MAG: hypothetical protein AAGL34_16550, partial [Bacteroidota bacterium]
MLGKLLFTAQWLRHSVNTKTISKRPFLRQFLVLLAICSFGQLSAQQLDTWFTADRAVNIDPIPNGSLHLFTPYSPADGTPVTTWYDFVDFTSPDNAIPHPLPAISATYQLAPPMGFDYPFGTDDIDYLFPNGSIPGEPTLRRNVFNFNPAIHFDADANNDGSNNGPGQARHFRSVSRNETTVFIVFQGVGSGNTAETQRLLYGGDIQNHPLTSRATNLSLGISDGNRFSVGRTRAGGDANASMFQSGNFDLLGRPTIGMFQREILSQFQERLTSRVNGIDDLDWTRNEAFPIADTPLFPFNRLGKHFNSTDATPERNLHGYIAEVLVLDTPAEINQSDAIERIESYLAIKYGITLNPGSLGSINGNTGYNYLAANGDVIWDFDINNPYNFDIAGIGKDRYQDIDGGNNTTSYDDTKLRYNLYQRISKSVNPEAIVTISTNSDFTSDNLDPSRTPIAPAVAPPAAPTTSYRHNYLLWGNDRGDLNLTASEVPGGVSDRIGREWRVQKTVSPFTTPIADVSIKIELAASNIPLTSPCDIYLIIDRDGDGDFTTGMIDRTPATSIMGTDVFFENINFNNSDVFSVGYEESTPDIDPIVAGPVACGSYILTLAGVGITGDNLANPTFYTESGGPLGPGVMIPVNTLLDTTTTVFVWDDTGNPNCFDEEGFTVTITETVTPTFGFTTTYCEGATPD